MWEKMNEKSHITYKELLYEEAVYTLLHQLNLPKAERTLLLGYLQQVFAECPVDHQHFVQNLKQKKAPAHNLKVTVLKAENLTPKNLNGSSDPFCTVGLTQGVVAPRLSREFSSCESLIEVLPDRTDTCKSCLNPEWNATFYMRINDVNSSVFSLYIWNEAQESSLLQDLGKVASWQGAKTLSRRVVRRIKRLSSTDGTSRFKTESDFLGLLKVPLKELPALGQERSYNLLQRSPRSRISGRCTLHTMFVTEQRESALSREVLEAEAHENLLRHIVEWEHKKQMDSWTGELSKDALHVICLHAAQVDMSLAEQAIIWWFVFSEHYVTNRFGVDFLLKLLENVEELVATDPPLHPQQERRLQDSFSNLLNHSLTQLQTIHSTFPLSDTISLLRLRDLLKCVVQTMGCRLYNKACLPQDEATAAVTAALQDASRKWYEGKKEVLYNATLDKPEMLQSLVGLTECMQVELKGGTPKYSQVIRSMVDVNFLSLWYQEMEKMLAADIQRALGTLRADCRPEDYRLDGELGEALQQLQQALQRMITQAGRQDLREDSSPFCTLDCWFEEAICTWLGRLRDKMCSTLHSAVQKDTLESREGHKLCGLSAAITACWLPSGLAFWLRLSWSRATQSLHMLAGMLQDVSYGAAYYSELMKHKLESDFGSSSTIVPKQVYVGLNSLEFVRQAFQHVPLQRDWQEIKRTVRDLGRARDKDSIKENTPPPEVEVDLGFDCEALRKILEQGERALQAALARLYRWLATLVLTDLKSYLETINKQEAVTDAKEVRWEEEMLCGNIVSMCQCLYEETRSGLLRTLWGTVVQHFSQTLEDSQSHPRPLVYFSKLHSVLQSLVEVFQADSQGLPLCDLQTDAYQALETELDLRRSNSTQLIERYFQERVNRQASTALMETLGILLLGCRYETVTQTLVLDIDGLQHLPDPRPVGQWQGLLCWPALSSLRVYIKLMLRPHHIFFASHDRKTKPHKHGAHIPIRETFKLHWKGS
uniref:BAI1-associated protein 3-like isoform X2 n=1 Tax=Myxine glutinosa TaxID=7769 RepID=UPI00358FBCA5